MPDNGYIWNSDFGRKPKKDPYDNPMGFTEKPAGITSDAEDINRQSRETDNAIGAEASRQRKADPVRIPENEPVRPAPAPAIEPQPEKTDKADTNGTNGNRFGYADKAYSTGGDETARRDREYEDKLRMDSGNEGFIMPPVQPSGEKNESTPDERQKLEEHSANEGFTIGDSESYRQLQAESQKRIENLTAFLGTFLEGNEKEERFANGLPAPGEAHQSIKDMDDSTFGQGLKDIYHGGARGMYELGNRGVTILDWTNRDMSFATFPYPVTPYAMLEKFQKGLGMEERLDGKYELYKLKKNLRSKAEEHGQAQSEDYRNSGFTSNQEYLGVKGTGEFARDLPSILTAGAIVNSAGAGWGALYAGLEGGVGELVEHYDKEVDRYMGMSPKEMEQFPEYVQAIKEGKTEEQARFRAADPRAKKGALVSVFAGVVKGMMKHEVGKLTGSRTDSLVTKIIQDFFGGRGADEFMRKPMDKFNDIYKKYRNN